MDNDVDYIRQFLLQLRSGVEDGEWEQLLRSDKFWSMIDSIKGSGPMLDELRKYVSSLVERSARTSILLDMVAPNLTFRQRRFIQNVARLKSVSAIISSDIFWHKMALDREFVVGVFKVGQLGALQILRVLSNPVFPDFFALFGSTREEIIAQLSSDCTRLLELAAREWEVQLPSTVNFLASLLASRSMTHFFLHPRIQTTFLHAQAAKLLLDTYVRYRARWDSASWTERHTPSWLGDFWLRIIREPEIGVLLDALKQHRDTISLVVHGLYDWQRSPSTEHQTHSVASALVAFLHHWYSWKPRDTASKMSSVAVSAQVSEDVPEQRGLPSEARNAMWSDFLLERNGYQELLESFSLIFSGPENGALYSPGTSLLRISGVRHMLQLVRRDVDRICTCVILALESPKAATDRTEPEPSDSTRDVPKKVDTDRGWPSMLLDMWHGAGFFTGDLEEKQEETGTTQRAADGGKLHPANNVMPKKSVGASGSGIHQDPMTAPPASRVLPPPLSWPETLADALASTEEQHFAVTLVMVKRLCQHVLSGGIDLLEFLEDMPTPSKRDPHPSPPLLAAAIDLVLFVVQLDPASHPPPVCVLPESRAERGAWDLPQEFQLRQYVCEAITAMECVNLLNSRHVSMFLTWSEAMWCILEDPRIVWCLTGGNDTYECVPNQSASLVDLLAEPHNVLLQAMRDFHRSVGSVLSHQNRKSLFTVFSLSDPCSKHSKAAFPDVFAEPGDSKGRGVPHNSTNAVPSRDASRALGLIQQWLDLAITFESQQTSPVLGFWGFVSAMNADAKLVEDTRGLLQSLFHKPTANLLMHCTKISQLDSQTFERWLLGNAVASTLPLPEVCERMRSTGLVSSILGFPSASSRVLARLVEPHVLGSLEQCSQSWEPQQSGSKTTRRSPMLQPRQTEDTAAQVRRWIECRERRQQVVYSRCLVSLSKRLAATQTLRRPATRQFVLWTAKNMLFAAAKRSSADAQLMADERWRFLHSTRTRVQSSRKTSTGVSGIVAADSLHTQRERAVHATRVRHEKALLEFCELAVRHDLTATCLRAAEFWVAVGDVELWRTLLASSHVSPALKESVLVRTSRRSASYMRKMLRRLPGAHKRSQLAARLVHISQRFAWLRGGLTLESVQAFLARARRGHIDAQMASFFRALCTFIDSSDGRNLLEALAVATTLPRCGHIALSPTKHMGSSIPRRVGECDFCAHWEALPVGQAVLAIVQLLGESHVGVRQLASSSEFWDQMLRPSTVSAFSKGKVLPLLGNRTLRQLVGSALRLEARQRWEAGKESVAYRLRGARPHHRPAPMPASVARPSRPVRASPVAACTPVAADSCASGCWWCDIGTLTSESPVVQSRL